MRKVTFILLLAILPAFIMAQGGPIQKGGKDLNGGIGFWTTGTGFMPLHAGMDFGITDDISVGFDVGWRFSKDGWFHNVFVFAGRGDYHFNNLLNLDKQWDVYAGLRLGPAMITASSDYPGSRKGFNFAVDGYAGGRWFFSDKFALNAELGLMGVFPDIVGPNFFTTFGITFIL